MTCAFNFLSAVEPMSLSFKYVIGFSYKNTSLSKLDLSLYLLEGGKYFSILVSVLFGVIITLPFGLLSLIMLIVLIGLDFLVLGINVGLTSFGLTSFGLIFFAFSTIDAKSIIAFSSALRFKFLEISLKPSIDNILGLSSFGCDINSFALFVSKSIFVFAGRPRLPFGFSSTCSSFGFAGRPRLPFGFSSTFSFGLAGRPLLPFGFSSFGFAGRPLLPFGFSSMLRSSFFVLILEPFFVPDLSSTHIFNFLFSLSLSKQTLTFFGKGSSVLIVLITSSKIALISI